MPGNSAGLDTTEKINANWDLTLTVNYIIVNMNYEWAENV